MLVQSKNVDDVGVDAHDENDMLMLTRMLANTTFFSLFTGRVSDLYILLLTSLIRNEKRHSQRRVAELYIANDSLLGSVDQQQPFFLGLAGGFFGLGLSSFLRSAGLG